MPQSRAALLIMDASVLIDFCAVDCGAIRLITEHIGKVHVPLPLLREEVPDIEASSYAELGIIVVVPPFPTAMQAAVRRAGLSFHDHVCLLLARDNGWTCVTNDGRLRRECVAEGVPVLWGLETLAMRVDGGAIDAKSAEAIGRAVQRVNPRFITDPVIAAFVKRIAGTGRR